MLALDELRYAYPDFLKIVDLISAQNPLQRKRIVNFFNSRDNAYFEYAESICSRLTQAFFRNDHDRIEAAHSYNRMTMDFLREQIRFSKTGVYHNDNAASAEKNVYSRPDVMRYYMVGLFLSYLLWPNHFEIIKFYRSYIQQTNPVEDYLEIAPGHGLFTMAMKQRFPMAQAILLDISQTSIEVTKEILSAFKVDLSDINLFNKDFLSAEVSSRNFDFISMGEVLEHVENPLKFLERARDILSLGGVIFMSTCVNCPAIDHVYNFCNIDEIRDLINKAGLVILKDKSLPLEIMSQEQVQKGLVAFNYCSILSKGYK